MKYILVLILLCVASPTFADSVDKNAKMPFVIKAYAYPTTANQKNGAVFLEIQNNLNTPLHITKAHSDIADKIELHTHLMDGDTMMMRAVDRFEIPASSHVKPNPMGDHIMLLGLKQQLKTGATFPLTLSIDKEGEINLDVQIGFYEDK